MLPYLAPGRRGAWLIPLSGPLPWTAGNPTPPAWLATAPGPSITGGTAPLPAPSSSTTHPASSAPAPPSITSPSKRPRTRPRTIPWTDARLRATWFWLDRLHLTGKMGPVWAECVTAAQSGGRMPDHIRVHAMAHLALALRRMLGLVDVRSTGWKGGGCEGDGERFLCAVRLVWVDEGGRGVLVA